MSLNGLAPLRGGVLKGGLLSGVMQAARAELALDALTYDPSTYEMLGVRTGTGDVSIARTSTRYVADVDGVYQEIAATIPAWSGARYSGGVAYADDGTGTLLTEQPWLSGDPAATYAQIRSNDLADAEWTASNMTVGDQDETGIDGLPATACTLTATAANATLIANAITDASDDQSTCWWIKRKTGTGNVDLSLDNGSTWTTVTLDSTFQKFTVDQAALANPQIGIRLVTDTDAVIVGNAECHLGKVAEEVRDLPPIFTEGTAVSIQADVPTLDIANHNNDEVCYYCEWSPGYSYDEIDISQAIITTNNGVTVLHDSGTTGRMASYDGSNSAIINGLTYAAGDVLKLGVIASAADSSMRICVDGVWGDAQAYDGAYSILDALTLMRSIYPMKMRNLQRYALSGSDAQKAKIDELMVTRLTADSFTDRLVDESGNYFTV